MKNSHENIGEKIRAERLRADLTQSELAGDHITRNMLSMIENGEATPSLDTVVYIADRLNVPAGIFFAESERDEALFTKADAVSKARALFADGHFDDAADVCKPHPYDDELSLILAESLLKRAESYMERFMLKSAAENIKEARTVSKRCKYTTEDFTGTLDAYASFISFANDRIDPDDVARLAKAPARIPAGTFVFLTALSHVDRGNVDEAEKLVASLPYLSGDQMKYLKAKFLASEFKFSKALDILLPLRESSSLGFIGRYRIVADIEGCYENKRDFESAYKYSSEKHKILESFMK